MKDDKAEAVMVSILQGASLSVVDTVLLDAGIVEVEGICRPADYKSDEGSELASTIITPVATPTVSPARSDGTTTSVTREPSPIPQTSRPAAVVATSQTSNPELATRPSATVAASRSPSISISRASDALSVSSSAPDPTTAESVSLRDSIPRQGAFVTVLDRMIKFKDRSDGLPDCGEVLVCNPSESNEWYENLASDAGFNARSLERDRKVGAAGELLVSRRFSCMCPLWTNDLQIFELLNDHYRFTGFSIGAWKSTIRSLVSAHPKYANLTPWNGSETADIVYSDVEGELTEALVELQYLDDSVWTGARPDYYIEVKTTTGKCEEPFYMSDSQYRRVCGLYTTSRNLN